MEHVLTSIVPDGLHRPDQEGIFLPHIFWLVARRIQYLELRQMDMHRMVHHGAVGQLPYLHGIHFWIGVDTVRIICTTID